MTGGWPDAVNAAFELLAGVALFFNVLALIKAQRVQGVNLYSVMFFTVWGCWNLFYYPHLGQWMSFLGGAIIVSMNMCWLILAVVYTRRHRTSVRRVMGG